MTKKPETVKRDDLIEEYGVLYKKYPRKHFTGCAMDYHEPVALSF